MRDPRRDAHGDLRARRCREGQLFGRDGRRGERDHVRHRAVAHPLLERLAVEHVPGTRTRLASRRLDEVGLRPRHLAVEELLAALVEDPGEAPVELRQRHELGLAERRVGHVPAVELVHSRRHGRTPPETETQAVADAPRIGAKT